MRIYPQMTATAEHYIEALRHRTITPETLEEELSAFAYKLRNPEAKIRKVFINCVNPEHKGIHLPMNFCDTLAKMFPSNTAISVYGATEKYDPIVSYCLSLVRGSLFACWNDPTPEHVPAIIKLATQTEQERGIEYKGIIVVNTDKQSIIDRIPADKRILVGWNSTFTPEQKSMFQMLFDPSSGGVNIAELLPAYFREIYTNPYDEWEP